MRELTFKGFLKRYVTKLSLHSYTSLYKLLNEAENENARLLEPVLLYAVMTLKKSTLDTFVEKSEKCKNDYYEFFVNGLNESMLTENSSVPFEYKKVYKSYLTVKNSYENDNHTKMLIRNKIIELKEQKNISDYRIYTDVRVNSGNYNSYIKHQKYNCISLENARSMLRYLMNY